MQLVSSRIWTRVIVSVPYNDNHYTTGTYADDLVLLSNSPTQAESQLHSMEQAAGGISSYMNANKTNFMYLKKKRHLCFKWQASEVSRPVHIAWQQYLIYWKWCQHISYEVSGCYWLVIDYMEIFQAVVVSVLLYGCTTWTNEMDGNKTRWELYKNTTCCFEQMLEATHHKVAAVQPLTSYLTTYPRWRRHVANCWRS